MLTHIVFFKLTAPNPVILKEAENRILDLKEKIPFLRYLEVGIDILHSDRSYDIALISKFDSLDDMQAYQVHPDHVAVANFMASIRENSVSVDYCG